MAQVLFKGVPDFTQVHIEVEKGKREVASISASPVKLGAGTAAKELKDVSTAAEKAATSTKKVTAANELLGDSFGNIYKKMLVWQVMGTMVSKTLGAFHDALDMMQKVADELVTVIPNWYRDEGGLRDREENRFRDLAAGRFVVS